MQKPMWNRCACDCANSPFVSTMILHVRKTLRSRRQLLLRQRLILKLELYAGIESAAHNSDFPQIGNEMRESCGPRQREWYWVLVTVLISMLVQLIYDRCIIQTSQIYSVNEPKFVVCRDSNRFPKYRHTWIGRAKESTNLDLNLHIRTHLPMLNLTCAISIEVNFSTISEHTQF